MNVDLDNRKTLRGVIQYDCCQFERQPDIPINDVPPEDIGEIHASTSCRVKYTRTLVSTKRLFTIAKSVFLQMLRVISRCVRRLPKPIILVGFVSMTETIIWPMNVTKFQIIEVVVTLWPQLSLPVCDMLQTWLGF